MYPTTRNSVLNAGYVYFDQLLDATTSQYAGELYLANTPSVQLSVQSGGNVKDYDADGPLASLILDVDTMVDRTLTFTLKHMSAAAFALFLPGDISTKSSTAGSVTAQPINGGKGVRQGYWYQLGADLYPSGIRAITTLVIKDAVPTTYDITDDYLADLTMGRIYIVPGGAIADDTVITADFAKTSVDWEQVAAGRTLGQIRGRFRAISAATAGENRDLYVPDGILTPTGDIAWKSRDTVQQIGFTLRIQLPTAVDSAGNPLAPIYINGRAS